MARGHLCGAINECGRSDSSRRSHRVGRGALRPPAPLRTVRDSFPSYGSSIPERHPCGMPRLYRHHSLCVTHLLPSNVALTAPSLGAPAEAVCCFPIYEGSPDSLAMEHLSDVGTRFTGAITTSPVFALSRVSCSIRLVTRRPLLLPTSLCRPSMGLPYGRLAMHRAWRTDGLSTFHVIAFTDNLGGTWTPAALRSRAGNHETCNLATHANTR